MGKVKAAIFKSVHKAPGWFLQIEDVPRPQLEAGHVLLRVVACGVCRTDLHIVEGDLSPVKPQLIPGHQIVREVVEGTTTELPLGTRVGVSWIGGVDGDCWYCHHGMENLCDKPTFIRPQVTLFPLDDANKPLLAVKEETEHGSAVIVP
jgi:propanol-preferring alcohol dehydrogenase